MTNQAWICSSIACAALLTIALPAQQPGVQPSNADIAGLPAGRGIYYHGAPGWVALQSTLLMPFPNGVEVMEFLNLKPSRNGVAEIRGPHAAVQIGSARPTFYLRGIAG